MAGSAINLTGMIAQMNHSFGRMGQDVGQGLFNPLLKMQEDERRLQAASQLQAERIKANAAATAELEKQRELRVIERQQNVSNALRATQQIDARVAKGDLSPEQVMQLEESKRAILAATPGAVKAQQDYVKAQLQIENQKYLLQDKRDVARQDQAFGALVAGRTAQELGQAGFTADQIAAGQERFTEYQSKMAEYNDLLLRKTPLKEEAIPEEFARGYAERMQQFGAESANKWLATEQNRQYTAIVDQARKDKLAYQDLDAASRIQYHMTNSQTEGWFNWNQDAQEKFNDIMSEEPEKGQEMLDAGADAYAIARREGFSDQEAIARATHQIKVRMGLEAPVIGSTQGNALLNDLNDMSLAELIALRESRKNASN